MSTENEKENKNSRRVGFIIAEVVILLLMAVCVFLMCQRPKEVVVTSEGNNIGLDTTQTDEVEVEADQDFIYFTGFDDISVEAGGTMDLPCNESNADGDIYMTYQILEDGEVVYETGLIEAGNHVEFNVAEVLGAGEHEITLHEQPYQVTDSEKELSTENMEKLYFVDQTITVTVAE